MRNRLADNLTIRAALLAGFGLTLGLWLFAGYQITLRMRDAQQERMAANDRYVRAQELLSSVRTQILVASVLVRDALLDPRAVSVGTHRQQIEAVYDSIDDELGHYVPFLGTVDERERVGRLRDEIREFRAATNDVLATDSSRWPTDAGMLLRRFMPRREAAIRISEEVQALNRSAFVEQQRAVTAMHSSLQRQVLTVFGAALAISFAIGLLAYRHSTRLETRLTEQRRREERIVTDLQRLSARLLEAQEDEQRRIARELHDEVGQALSAVKVELAVAQGRLERLGSGAELLSDARASADSALRSVRDLSHLLHPPVLDDLGLVAALDSYIGDYRRRHDVQVDFVHTAFTLRLHSEIEVAVYRIVQEALTNISRHAEARTARIVLHADGRICRVVIADDGVGFDVDDVERPGRRRGLGLLGIRERVAKLRGTVTIDSNPAYGTRITVELPEVHSSAALVEHEDAAAGAMLTSRPQVDHG